METFRCGHPRTVANTYKSTARYGRCRTCYNAYLRNYRRAATAALREKKGITP